MKTRLTETGRLRVALARTRELMQHYEMLGRHQRAEEQFALCLRHTRQLRDLGIENGRK